jgi:hypothetical protein
MKQIFYKKVGRRYVPVSEYDNALTDALPNGAHLIIVNPGGKSTRYNIDPALAPMIAAGRYAEDKMLDAIRKISEARPSVTQLTEEQQQAWKIMQEALGEDRFYLTYPSHFEIVQEGIKAMQNEAEKMLTNPSVKKAYEHFLLVAELTKEEHND